MIKFNQKNNFYLCVLLWAHLPVYGSIDQGSKKFSLFYSLAEQKTIDDRRLQSCSAPHNIVSSTIRLNGVAYINDQQWSVWINNHRIDPEHPGDGIDIIKVDHDGIVFRLSQDHEAVIHHLRINQSLNLNAFKANDNNVDSNAN